MSPTRLLYAAALVTSLVCSTEAINCLTCSNALSLSDASCVYKTCPASEVGCYVQYNTQLDGTELVNARCISDGTCNDILFDGSVFKSWLGTKARSGCCRTDFCTPIFPVTVQKKKTSCRLCQGEDDINNCKIQQCSSMQNTCFMQMNRDSYGKVSLFSRCVEDAVCPLGEKLLTSDHFQTDICEACCHGDDCNKDLCKSAFPAFSVKGSFVNPLLG